MSFSAGSSLLMRGFDALHSILFCHNKILFQMIFHHKNLFDILEGENVNMAKKTFKK